MKHLDLPLVDSYLLVRSRRLSVLIQPNMRLLFNLLGWEVQVAQAKIKSEPEPQPSDPARLLSSAEEETVKFLSTSLPWPFLAREIHRLNAKYIR
jgi:dual specificity MAP kinase phosphatase